MLSKKKTAFVNKKSYLSLIGARFYIWDIVLAYYLGRLKSDEKSINEAFARALKFASARDYFDVISPRPAALIADPNHAIVVSSASVWEIAIKHGLARGLASDMPVAGCPRVLPHSWLRLLAVTADHAAAAATLPPLHRDPFDRIIVAQTLHEPLRLITHDPKVKAYSDALLLF
jgi:PIN domain nuclease of toxin-antitoxin system